jgi:hypothetical protein
LLTCSVGPSIVVTLSSLFLVMHAVPPYFPLWTRFVAKRLSAAHTLVDAFSREMV